MCILFSIVHRKTNFLAKLYGDNEYSDSDSINDEPEKKANFSTQTIKLYCDQPQDCDFHFKQPKSGTRQKLEPNNVSRDTVV